MGRRVPGPPLVLCHGYTGSSHDFALQVEPLSESRRVIVAGPARPRPLVQDVRCIAGYTIDQLTADLIGFIEQVSEGPVDLLGHSMGGRVSLGVVLARPDLIRSLMLMDTSAWSFLPDDEKVRTMVADYMEAFDPGKRHAQLLWHQRTRRRLDRGGHDRRMVAA